MRVADPPNGEEEEIVVVLNHCVLELFVTQQ